MNIDEKRNRNAAIDDLDVTVPDVIPVLPADGLVIFPYMTARIVIPSKHKPLLEDALKANGLVGVLADGHFGQKSNEKQAASIIGSMISVRDLSVLPDGNALVDVKGLVRIRIMETTSTDPYLTARVERAREWAVDEIEAEALRRRLVKLSTEVIDLTPQIPEGVKALVESFTSPLKLAYVVAGNLQLDLPKQMSILRHDHVEQKMKFIIDLLQKELEVLKVSQSIDEKVNDKMTSKQREYHLRQQLEAIRKELGEDDASENDVDDYSQRVQKSAMSAEARTQAERELKRLGSMNPNSAEFPIIQNYLDWLLDLPWGEPEAIKIELDAARKTLDKEHFGMETVKERIVEYLAVHQLQRDRREQMDADQRRAVAKGVILCLVGPPGTGKTSLGKSIAAAMGRKYTRMSLGGIRDESEIRGHRRTYVGALPGRIVQALKRAGSRNPVFVLDEVDKIGQDWRGDPGSALLEVLDPEQNAAFRDHYLDVDFDLSEVVFVATANQLELIPVALRDRMDVIALEGYTAYEKFQIAKNHLIPRQLVATGLFENEVTFMDDAIRKTIEDYTREAGVRSLERQIGIICRKSAVALQQNGWHSIAITSDQVRKFLKREMFEHDLAEESQMPGIATGLAVTAAGGEILHIEATRMHGKGGLKLTGQLGEVMKESGHIAHSYVRSRARSLGIDPDMFDTNDVHLHIPAGALPKDGPSAGVVMTLALASVFMEKPIPGTIGTTGEITLRGRVLPVGGIKMKLLAAHRAGLTRLMIPRRNKGDIEDLPADAADTLRIDLVDNMDDIMAIVFPESAPPSASKAAGAECRDTNCNTPVPA